MKILFKIILLLLIIFYACQEKEVFQGLPPEPEEVFGKLYIDSNPQGAQIFLDKISFG